MDYWKREEKNNTLKARRKSKEDNFSTARLSDTGCDKGAESAVEAAVYSVENQISIKVKR